jgi:hypothetical protein
MHKIYFAGSISGGREDVDVYPPIIEYLGRYGKVLTEHIGNKAMTQMGESIPLAEIYRRDMEWLSEANIVVAEVTKVSLGVGYELGRMVERNISLPKEKKKEMLCLYRPQKGRRLSPMISQSESLEIVEYGTFEEAKAAIDAFFASVKEK